MALFLAFSIFLISENELNIYNPDLVGTWKVIDYQADSDDSLSLNILRKQFLSSLYTFYEDNSLKIRTDLGSVLSEGKWSYITERNRLVITYNSSLRRPESFVIKSITNGKMEWRLLGGAMGEATITLQKQ